MPDALTMLPLRCPEGCGRIEVLDQEDGSWRKRLDCMLEHGEVEDVEEVCRLILHPPLCRDKHSEHSEFAQSRTKRVREF